MWPRSRTKSASAAPSIQRRLETWIRIGLGALVAVSSISISLYANEAAQRSSDQLLLASALTIAGSVRIDEGAIIADIPVAAFSMLATEAQDRAFYRLVDDRGRTVTGYPDLAAPASDSAERVFYQSEIRGFPVRIVAVRQLVTAGERARWATVMLAQTENGRIALAWQLAFPALAGLLVMAAAAAVLVHLAIRYTLQSIRGLGPVIEARSPGDLSPLDIPLPAEVEPLRKALNALILRFEASLSRTREFLADTAHQLRTPLASLRSLAETTLRDCRDETLAERLERIDRNVRLAGRIVDQLLTDAMIVNRAEAAVRQRVPLGPLVADVINDFAALADAPSIRLFVEERGENLVVEGDPFALSEALRNLIDNAVKYAPGGKPIDVTIDADVDGSASISVADRGPGVALEDMARVVRRFERSADRQTIGLGLGLAIVSRVAEAHGGALKLSTRPGGGLVATLAIPAQTMQEAC